MSNPTKKEKNQRKRPLTREEKEIYLQNFEKKIRIHNHLLNPLISGEWSEEEIRTQERDLCDHSKTKEKDGFIICRVCGIKIEKKKERKVILTNLFCTHKEIIEKDGFIVCVRCNTKWRGEK